MTPRRPRIRTVDVLEVCPDGAFSCRDVDDALGEKPGTVSGHLDFLAKQGKLAKLGPNRYELTAFGRKARGPRFGEAA